MRSPRATLAHLERHQQRELVGLLDDRLVRAPQDFAALARRVRAPLGLRVVGGGERGKGVLDGGVGDVHELLGGGGVLDGERGATAGRAPASADVQLGGHAREDRALGL